jgi:hypothetical protein
VNNDLFSSAVFASCWFQLKEPHTKGWAQLPADCYSVTQAQAPSERARPAITITMSLSTWWTYWLTAGDHRIIDQSCLSRLTGRGRGNRRQGMEGWLCEQVTATPQPRLLAHMIIVLCGQNLTRCHCWGRLWRHRTWRLLASGTVAHYIHIRTGHGWTEPLQSLARTEDWLPGWHSKVTLYQERFILLNTPNVQNWLSHNHK